MIFIGIFFLFCWLIDVLMSKLLTSCLWMSYTCRKIHGI
uniref:Uncharacterized protein n=1 Tax=Arundo donax TaxID=35708 RepID=A0A0A8XVX2_ARUDO